MTMLDLAVERLEDGTSRAIALEELIELRAKVAPLEPAPPLRVVVWVTEDLSPMVRVRLQIGGFTFGSAFVPRVEWPALRTMFKRGGFVVDDEDLAHTVSAAAE